MTNPPLLTQEKTAIAHRPSISLAAAHVVAILVFYVSLSSASRYGPGLLLGLIAGPGLFLTTISTIVISLVILFQWIRRDKTQKQYLPGLTAWMLALIFCCAFSFYIFFLQGLS